MDSLTITLLVLGCIFAYLFMCGVVSEVWKLAGLPTTWPHYSNEPSPVYVLSCIFWPIAVCVILGIWITLTIVSLPGKIVGYFQKQNTRMDG